jgi:hypothetical protein
MVWPPLNATGSGQSQRRDHPTSAWLLCAAGGNPGPAQGAHAKGRQALTSLLEMHGLQQSFGTPRIL